MGDKSAPVCPYCGAIAECVGGNVIYPNRPDLDWKLFWRCSAGCDAYVGCHSGTNYPLGRLANAELRRAKAAAHRAFDPLWRAKIARDGCPRRAARSAAYAWLSRQLGTALAETHIGMFDVPMCHRVIEACAPYAKGARHA